ncbi:1876_t:CDS:2, partial [Paraglomus occultum]
MEKNLLTKLSNEIVTLLKHEDTCDIVIIAGMGMDQMQFKGHSLILCARSEYFAETIKQRMNVKEDGLQLYRDSFIDLSNIPSSLFELIFRYLYSGVIDLSKLTVDTIFTLIDPLHELHLHELIDYIQEYLITNRHRWIYTEFISTYYILSDIKHIPKFRQFVNELLCTSPELLLRSEDFTIIDEDLLTDLLRRDDLNMPTAEIWDRLLEWAAANPIMPADTTLSQEKTLANTLKDFLPL